MVLSFAAAVFTPFFISFIVCALMIRLAPKVGLVDKPGERKIHDHVMPTGGGLGVWCAVVLPILAAFAVAVWLDSIPLGEPATLCGYSIPDFLRQHASGVLYQSHRLWSLLGLGTILVILGTVDDRRGLDWKLRLSVQTLVAIFAVALGWEATFFVKIPWLTKVLSVIWIVGLINSFNMLDNMDGLSAGVASICATFLAVVFLVLARNAQSGEPQLFLGGFLLILVGALLGFLMYNRPPAKLFMGDGGAYFVGFLLAVTTLSATFVDSSAPKQAILVPLCILAVPLYDTASVVFIRLRSGRSPFVGDKNHYSHRLVAIGFSKPAAVATIYLTTAVCAVSALFLYEVTPRMAFLVVAQVAMILTLVGLIEFTARRQKRD